MRLLAATLIAVACAAVQAQAGLFALWQFNEGSGQTFADSTASHLNGYFGSSPSPDVKDPAWSANGAGRSGLAGDYALSMPTATLNDWGTVDDTNALTPATGHLTIVADIDPVSWHQGVIVGQHGGSSNGSYMLDVNTTDGLLLFMIVNSSGARVNVGWQPPAGDVNNGYHQLVGTYDGTTMRLYYDGVLRATASQTGAINNPSQPLLFGDYNANNNSWEYDGLIDNVALFDQALSDGGVEIGSTAPAGSGIYQLYHQGAASFLPEPTMALLLAAGGLLLLARPRRTA